MGHELSTVPRTNGGLVKQRLAVGIPAVVVSLMSASITASAITTTSATVARASSSADSGRSAASTATTTHVSCPPKDGPGGSTGCYRIPPGFHNGGGPRGEPNATLGNMASDFNFTQPPRKPVLLPTNPRL